MMQPSSDCAVLGALLGPLSPFIFGFFESDHDLGFAQKWAALHFFGI
jgi:hypothetical protein